MDYQVPKLAFDYQMRDELHERAYRNWDRYYTRRCEQSDEEIARRWRRDFSSLEAYEASVAPNREHLRALLGGWRWERGDLAPESMVIDKCAAYSVTRVFITIFEDVRLDFLLLVPNGLTAPAPVILAQHGLGSTPEDACGFVPDPGPYNAFGSRLAERGYVVAAPRMMGPAAKRNWLYRKAMLMGENLFGAEMFMLSRVVDYLRGRECAAFADPERIGIYGLSQGGMAALYFPALDQRIKLSVASGHFYWMKVKMVVPAEKYLAYIVTSEEDKFIQGELLEFSEADIASLICPRYLCIEYGLQDPVLTQLEPENEYPKIREVYDKLGIPERLVLATHPGGHEVVLGESLEFVRKNL
jgi:dienelactone hydrolase